MDLDACADAARPFLLSTSLFEAAMGRRSIQGGLGQWISTPVRTLLDLPCFRLCCPKPRWDGARFKGGWGSGSRRLCGPCSTSPAFDVVVRSRAGVVLDSRGAGAVDLDACADAARPFLLSTLVSEAAMGGARFKGGWGSGSRRLCGPCSSFPAFDFVFRSRDGRRLIQGGLGQWISTLVLTLHDLFCFRLCCT